VTLAHAATLLTGILSDLSFVELEDILARDSDGISQIFQQDRGINA
jgi:hypothetical protein